MENDRKKLQMDMAENSDESTKSKNSRGLMILCAVLVLMCIGLLIGFIILASDKWTTSRTGITAASKTKCSDAVCNSPQCIISAGKMLEKIDPEVNPCDDFFEYSCGGWFRKTIIPEERSNVRVITQLREEQAVILKELFERPPSPGGEIDAFRKVKDFYSSCLNTELIETRDSEPLIAFYRNLGGWPVLGKSTGGNWNPSKFDLIGQMSRLLGGYNNRIIISTWVGTDEKNSSRYVIKVDQESLGMGGREYYLDEDKTKFREAYRNYFVGITTMLGATEATARNDFNDILAFETKLANASDEKEFRRDVENIYNPTTLGELNQMYPQFNWTRYFDLAVPEELRPIPDDEYIINYSPEYIGYAINLAMVTPPRVLANYLLWRITMNRVPSLSKRFRDVRQDTVIKAWQGTSKEEEKWRACVSYINHAFKHSVGRMYIDENFAGSSKKNVEAMIDNLSLAFKGMLAENKWMDEETKLAANEKAEAIREQIGYPDWTKEDDKLNEFYENFLVTGDKYFENIINFISWYADRDWKELRKPVDKNRWTVGAAEINAYYSPSKNRIVFPSGILQPPFYHTDVPRYLNYGAIGYIIGHEITHGFDDRGRKQDKDGNLVQWWSNSSISNFVDRAQCVVDQYNNYVMPEINKTLDGFQTQGENIADIGGIKESFKAFTELAYDNIKLPGFESFTPEQLFFINFGQTKCDIYRPESLERQILQGVHSPGRYRANGVLRNTPEFAKAFDCPEGSYMNPPRDQMCTVW